MKGIEVKIENGSTKNKRSITILIKQMKNTCKKGGKRHLIIIIEKKPKRQNK